MTKISITTEVADADLTWLREHWQDAGGHLSLQRPLLALLDRLEIGTNEIELPDDVPLRRVVEWAGQLRTQWHVLMLAERYPLAELVAELAESLTAWSLERVRAGEKY